MEAIGQLAGGIAHDFNNILGAVMGFTELAQMEAAGSPILTEYMGAVQQANKRAMELVKQILTFSRRREQERKPTSLKPVVEEVLKLLRASVPASIKFQTDLADTSTVLADTSAIHQIVMNLGTNAWHAMRDKPGTLKVSLSKMEVDADYAQAYPDLRPGCYVRLTVGDTGCGMDRATLERVFEPFFTTKAPGEGTGLGLSVVHGIMKSHDGGISVYSQPGEGTTFHLYFPVFEAEAAEPVGVAKPVPRGHGEHILFVDDEKPLVVLGKTILERLGYVVTTKTSVLEAVAAFRAQPDQFQLAITDLTMPGMNGMDFARQLLEIRPGIPIILTTGYSATMNSENAREMGFRELLIKPNTARTLGEAVHRVLSQSNSA